MSDKYKILIIDDEKIIRERIRKLLTMDGYEVQTAEDGPSGLELFKTFVPNIVITDIRMPNMDGMEVLRQIKEKSPPTDVILITGHGDMTSTIEALRIGAFDYINKPVDYDELTISIKRNMDLQAVKRDRERLQTELFQSAKLASVGTLTSGIAHELNNPLTVIIAYVEETLILLQNPEIPEINENKIKEITTNLNMIAKSSTRIQGIVKHMLAYARQTKPADWRPIDLNELIKNAFSFLERRYGHLNITTSFNFDPELPHSPGDPGQLESVFVNLLGNTADAFQTITDKREKFVNVSSAKHSKDTILITYEDNAGGMNEETLQRLFDPFFTTKEVGKGTGLGMFVVLGIVQAHKGTISAESKLGKGTKFTIVLPAAR